MTDAKAALYMRAALREARRALGRTAPNPPVGAVVVKGGRIIGRGYHRGPGLPHAEVEALNAAGARARGASLYVTLEPCAHYGRTPPCTRAIVAAGIRQVVYAIADPDRKVSGRGEAELRRAGIAVHSGVGAELIGDLYAPYLKQRLTGMPYGILKLACTLDGKVAAATGESQWITGERARKHVHRLRDEHDAVMVGVGTVLADDPQLTTRLRGGRDALRVIVDSRGRTPPTARAVRSESEAPCLIAVTEAAPSAHLERLREAGAEVTVLPHSADGRVDLQALFRLLGERGLLSVLIEGGPELAAGALEAGVVDRILLFVAPKVIGGSEARSVLGGKSARTLAEARELRIRKVRRFGPDLLIEADTCLPD